MIRWMVKGRARKKSWSHQMKKKCCGSLSLSLSVLIQFIHVIECKFTRWIFRIKTFSAPLLFICMCDGWRNECRLLFDIIRSNETHLMGKMRNSNGANNLYHLMWGERGQSQSKTSRKRKCNQIFFVWKINNSIHITTISRSIPFEKVRSSRSSEVHRDSQGKQRERYRATESIYKYIYINRKMKSTNRIHFQL